MSTYFKKNFFLSCFILFSFFNFYFVYYSAIAKNTSKLLTDIMPKVLNYSLKMQSPGLRNISLNNNNNNLSDIYSKNNINYLKNMNIDEAFKNILNKDDKDLSVELKKEKEEILNELNKLDELKINNNGDLLNIGLIYKNLGINNYNKDIKDLKFESNAENLSNSLQNINIDNSKNLSNSLENISIDNSPYAQMIKFNFLKSNVEDNLKKLSENFESKNNFIDENLKALSESFILFKEVEDLKIKEYTDLKDKNQELETENNEFNIEKEKLDKTLKDNENLKSKLNQEEDDLNKNIEEAEKSLKEIEIENKEKEDDLNKNIEIKQKKLEFLSEIDQNSELIKLKEEITIKEKENNEKKENNKKLEEEKDKIPDISLKYFEENGKLEEKIKEMEDDKSYKDEENKSKELGSEILTKGQELEFLENEILEHNREIKNLEKFIEENKKKENDLDSTIKDLQEKNNEFNLDYNKKDEENKKLASLKFDIQEKLIKKINEYMLFLHDYDSIIENIKAIYNLSYDLTIKLGDEKLNDLKMNMEKNIKSLEDLQEKPKYENLKRVDDVD